VASQEQIVAADTSLFTQGTQAWRWTMPLGGQIQGRRRQAFDNAKIADEDIFSIDLYCSKVPHDWVRISFCNDYSIGSGNILRKDVTTACSAGWNTVTWTKNEMVECGTWNIQPRALGIEIDVYHDVPEPVFFVLDNFYVDIAGETRLSV
jgi:hypothetical protein